MTEYIEQYKEWLKANKPDIAETSLRKLDKAIAELNRYLRARGKKAAVGVYGQSQSGKSYLVDSLLSHGDRSLRITGLGTFNQLIPEQYAESTAVTCRFTISTNQNVPEGYYLCELLSIGELFFIFLAGFNEFKHEEGYVNNVVSQLDDFKLVGNGLKIDRPHVYDMIYYISDDYSSSSTVVTPIIQKKLLAILEQSLNSGLSFDDLKMISNILFGSVKFFSEFILEIIRLYESIEYSNKILLPASLIKPFINTNNILKWNATDRINIGLNKTGKDYQIYKNGPFSLATLQIACAELILPVESSEQDFLEQVDMLDFPGLRPFQQGEETDQTAQSVARVLKQGKLKATFDLYCKRKEIPALIIASPWENASASSLPRKVVNWLDEYCSNDYSAAANRLLFFAMTKSDYLLSGNWRDNIKETLYSRFIAHYELEFNSMLEMFGARPFRNHYFTINPKFAATIDPHSITGAREIFINDELVRKHLGEQANELFDTFANPEAGIRRLVNNINLLADDLNNVKQNNVTRGINQHLQDVLRDIDLHIHDEDEVREQQLNKRRLREFAHVISNVKVHNELISYVHTCFPQEWEWSDNQDSDEVTGFVDFESFNDTDDVDIDSILSQANTAGNRNHLSDLIVKYQANLTDRFTPQALGHTHQLNAENYVMNYIQASINYFKNDKSFLEVIDTFSSIRATLDADSVVPMSQFNDAVRNSIISHCTGFMYHSGFKTSDIQNKIVKGLFRAAEISFQTKSGFDVEANEKIKSIKNNINNHVSDI